MIVLYQFRPLLGLPNASPFCLKVETWLRLAGLAYETRTPLAPLRAPLGKFPFVVIDDGRRIADSSCIVETLTQTHGVTLDAGLDDLQRAQAHLVAKLFEEHFYWAMIHARWIDPAGWSALQAAFFGVLPWLARPAMARLVRAKIRRDARGQGLALHSPAEIARRAAQDLAAVAAVLGERPFLLGATPASIDATAYGFLAQAWEASLETPLHVLVGVHPNLVAYCARMRARCFPELPPRAA